MRSYFCFVYCFTCFLFILFTEMYKVFNTYKYVLASFRFYMMVALGLKFSILTGALLKTCPSGLKFSSKKTSK